MAVPDKALELSLPDLDDWRLDDVELFETGGFNVGRFKAFMAQYSNWTRAEVGHLTMRERRQVMDQIITKVSEAAVPKANGTGS